MSIIELNTGNCHNCYKCIRECPVKAIAFRDGKAKIIESECILCGTCLRTCPQNMAYISDEVEEVKEYIRSGKKVYATIAPSWLAWYDSGDFSKLSAALKKLGFAGVEETAIGAAETSREYQKLLENGEMKNVIVTACNSVVLLIECYYPELIKMLAPVSSPMMAHAKLMRETYGDIKVVFIGPCLSKKQEAEDPLAGGLVNTALTFSALDDWLKQEGIVLDELSPDEEATGVRDQKARLYPKPRGILKTVPNYYKYTPVAVDGIQNCRELFDMMKNDEVTGLFVEANVCEGGCLGGPMMRLKDKKFIITQNRITDEPRKQDKAPAVTTTRHFSHPRVFTNRADRSPMPTEEQIREILAKIGKLTPDQELNCSSCGYPTCRDKAIAVFQGKADINMCLPYFRDKAESVSNMVIECSPNAIVAFDKDLMVQEMNPTAEQLFGVTRAESIGLPLADIYESDEFDEAKETGRPVIKKVRYADVNKVAEQSIVYVAGHDMYLAFIKDITADEKGQQKLDEMRNHTVEVAQNVIDKQMRVAQEIASLLGETTAETKVALTQLKKSMEGPSGD